MMIMLRLGEPSLPERLSAKFAWTGHPHLAWVIASVLAWWALALVLDRKRIYVRA